MPSWKKHEPEVEVVAEVAAETPAVHPAVPVATTTAAANLASRDNIVADGPGTVADFLP